MGEIVYLINATDLCWSSIEIALEYYNEVYGAESKMQIICSNNQIIFENLDVLSEKFPGIKFNTMPFLDIGYSWYLVGEKAILFSELGK